MWGAQFAVEILDFFASHKNIFLRWSYLHSTSKIRVFAGYRMFYWFDHQFLLIKLLFLLVNPNFWSNPPICIDWNQQSRFQPAKTVSTNYPHHILMKFSFFIFPWIFPWYSPSETTSKTSRNWIIAGWPMVAIHTKTPFEGPGGGAVHLRQSSPGRGCSAAAGVESAEGGALWALPDGGG